MFERLTAWLSPLAVFTMEEAWATRFPDAGSNCLRLMPHTPPEWRNDAEAARWAKVDKVVGVVTAALEVERRDKRIGGALEAAPFVYLGQADLVAAFDGLDAAEVFRTSNATLAEGGGSTGAHRLDNAPYIAVEALAAEGCKCDRCWRILPEVKPATRLCLRCEDAVADWDRRTA